jgi:hypothetical protein
MLQSFASCSLLRGTCNVTVAGEVADPSLWNARSLDAARISLSGRHAISLSWYSSFPQAMLISFA